MFQSICSINIPGNLKTKQTKIKKLRVIILLWFLREEENNGTSKHTVSLTCAQPYFYRSINSILISWSILKSYKDFCFRNWNNLAKQTVRISRSSLPLPHINPKAHTVHSASRRWKDVVQQVRYTQLHKGRTLLSKKHTLPRLNNAKLEWGDFSDELLFAFPPVN